MAYRCSLSSRARRAMRRARCPLERLKALRGGRLNEPRQPGKSHESIVGCQVLDRRIGRPLVQRIHEVQSGVPSRSSRTGSNRSSVISRLLAIGITCITRYRGYKPLTSAQDGRCHVKRSRWCAIPDGRALRTCSRKHLVGMDRCRAPGTSHKPHALGYRGSALWRRWISAAAVRVQQRARGRPSWLGRTGSYRARRCRAGLPCQLGTAVCSGSSRRSPLPRRDALDGSASRGRAVAGGIHEGENGRFRPDPARRARHRVGLGGRARITAECRARPLFGRRAGVGILHGRDAEGSARWIARCSYFCCRVDDALSACFRHLVGRDAYQRPMGRRGIAGRRAGGAHCYHFPAALWPGRQHPRCFERRCLRRALPCDDGAVGNPNPR